MLYIYTSIAVLFGGAYCLPTNNTTDKSPCTVVIKRFGEPVTTLEVEWHSTIHLICDASCVGPGPQPALTWFYRDKKNQSNLINIERQFRSPKFDTYSLTSHRTKELRIRDFGPNEETTFICKGSIPGKKHKQMAEVKLHGTDCLMKYKFRCQSDKKCIDQGQLCDYYNDCPDGEDEFGCDKNIYNTTTKATTRIPEKDVVINQTSEESDYIDLTMTVSTLEIPETDLETMQTSDDKFGPSCSEGKKACKDSYICIDDSQRCNGVPDCPDRGDEVDCDKVIMKTLMGGTGIHVDGKTDPVSTTDGVTARTAEFTKTTSFLYDDYI